ncbi:unnamed protein product, partial [Medioppia subpectinata]
QEKHQIICNKTKESQKRRKQFDSHKQRGDLEAVNGFPVSTPPSRPTAGHTDHKHKTTTTASTANSTSNWRAKHEEFLRTVRAARGEKVDEPAADGVAAESGGPRVPVGYIVCDFCGRNFSNKAADRHIQWCREQKARIPRSANNAMALERMKARTKNNLNTQLVVENILFAKHYKPKASKSSPKTETPAHPIGSTTTGTATNGTKVSAGAVTNGTKAAAQRSQASGARSQPPTPPVNRKTTTVRPSPPNSLKMSPKPQPKNGTRKTPPSPPTTKYTQNRINSLSRPKNNSPVGSAEQLIKHTEPVMKFKEKFPNHTNMTRLDGNFTKNREIIELLKKTEVYNGGPRTVPGVRTGGMSPVKSDSQMGFQNGHYNNNTNGNQLSSDEEELMKLKTRIEDLYLNGGTKSQAKQINGIVINGQTNGHRNGNHFADNHTGSESTTRGSTSGSSADSSSIHTPPRDRANSMSDAGTRSQASSAASTGAGSGSANGGIPKFCHQCGTKYPSTIAKYCYECGSRRLGTVGPFISP